MSAHDEQQVRFHTSDGVELVGDLLAPHHAHLAAVVGHPHPQYGGNRFNPVVEALYQTLPDVGVATFRFDFRPDFADGIGEQLDIAGAIAVLADRDDDLPLLACGYSFGAMMALTTNHERLAGRALIAPPLGHIDVSPSTMVPTLVLTPSHDQFAPPDVAEPIVSGWPDTTFEEIEMVDHFLAGRFQAVADRTADWVSDRWPPRSRP